MSEKLKGFWASVKERFSKLSKKARTLLFSAIALILIAAVVIALVLNNKPYAVLFTGLSAEESRAIVSYLEENGVTQYRLQNSDTITVPSGMEAKLKATLLMQGYPKSGFAYETYRSAVGAMSTESDRNIAYLQDLQDRMSAVIRCFDGVKDAVVTIVQEEDRRYILDSSSMTSASASVALTMSGGATLSDQQATAIRNLVARSVKGLSISNITISDMQGNNYYGGDSDSMASADASQLKLQLEDQQNKRARDQILEVLTPFYGAKNIKVTVNSTVDVSRTVGESTTYTQPDWAGGATGGRGIIGSEIYNREVVNDGTGNAGGVAGAQANADINTYVQNNMQVNGDEPYLRSEGETIFNNNIDKEQRERMAGVLTDMTVAVTLNSEVAVGMSREQLVGHIARASGIGPDLQADKISVVSGTFFEPTGTGNNLPGTDALPFPAWVLYAAAGGLVLLLVLMTLILTLRAKKKKRLAAELGSLLENQDSSNVVSEPSGVDIMTIKTEKSMELRKTIRQFAEENPEIAAYMLKNWLREEEEHA